MRNLNLGVRPTPQNKMVSVNNQSGNQKANQQQGTTFQIYDSLPLVGQTEFKFFKGAQRRPFPLTNLDQGMLTAGETTTILYGQILFVEYVDIANEDFTVVDTFPLIDSPQFVQGELNFSIENSRTLKQMKLQTWVDKFNKNSQINGSNVYYFGTDLTITSFLNFQASINIPAGITIDNTVAQMIIEGDGGIYASKTNY